MSVRTQLAPRGFPSVETQDFSQEKKDRIAAKSYMIYQLESRARRQEGLSVAAGVVSLLGVLGVNLWAFGGNSMKPLEVLSTAVTPWVASFTALFANQAASESVYEQIQELKKEIKDEFGGEQLELEFEPAEAT